MSLALLFPGQGTQHPAMLSWLDTEPAAREALALLAAALGPDWRGRLDDPSSSNTVAQSLLTGLCIAAWNCVAPYLPGPAICAGYSVGELPAFCAASVFDSATAIRLAHERAAAMDRSVAGRDTGLMAVQGVGRPGIDAACARHALEVAIDQGADPFVLGGLSIALMQAETDLAARGARCTRLAVRVASHTSWVAAAAHDFAGQLEAMTFQTPRVPLVCNLTGTAVRGAAEPARSLGRPQTPCVERLHGWIAERRVACA
jgi:[acyl-carrier-protein] S-malonyltransferase